MTGPAAWPACRGRWPMPASTSTGTSSWAGGATGRCSRSSSTIRTEPARSWSARPDRGWSATGAHGLSWVRGDMTVEAARLTDDDPIEAIAAAWLAAEQELAAGSGNPGQSEINARALSERYDD